MLNFLVLFLVFRGSLGLGRSLAGELETLLDGAEEPLAAVVQHGHDVCWAGDCLELNSNHNTIIERDQKLSQL